MSYSRRAALSAAVCSLAVLVASGACAETLADAIALAYQTNPTLQGQRATQRVLDESVVQARSGFRPQVGLSASATATDNEGDQSDRKASSATLSASQPLFTGGRVSAQVDAAAADVESGRESLRRVESSVLLSVIQAYVDVRRGEEALRISQENVTVLSRQREESQARFEVGEITRTNVAQAEARLAAAQASLASARSTLGIARAAYAAVVGQNPTNLAPEPSLATLLPATVDEAFAAAEANNAQVRAAMRAEEASRARVTAARAARRPTVSATASIGLSGLEVAGVGSQFADYAQAINTGVTASMPLFSGGLTSSQIRAAIERNNADRIAVETARRAVLQSVSQAWNQVLGARANLVANQEQVRAAAVASEGVRAENQVGLRTTLDVLNAEQELRSAQLALVTARRDEYVASANLLLAVGRLEAKNLAPEVPQYDPVNNFQAASRAIGWVPWEPVIEAVDRVGGPAPRSAPQEVPVATATPNNP
jgi:outer membrane protein